jgi:hypothetical protein
MVVARFHEGLSRDCLPPGPPADGLSPRFYDLGDRPGLAGSDLTGDPKTKRAFGEFWVNNC